MYLIFLSKMLISTFIGRIIITVHKDEREQKKYRIIIDYPNVLHDYVVYCISKVFNNVETSKDIVRNNSNWFKKLKRRIILYYTEGSYEKLKEKLEKLIEKLKFFENTRKLFTIHHGNYRMYVVKFLNEERKYMFIIYKDWGEIKEEVKGFKKISNRFLIKVVKFKQEIDEDKLFNYAVSLFKKSI